MLSLIRRLFRREAAPEPGSLVEELWAVDFASTRDFARADRAGLHRAGLHRAEPSRTGPHRAEPSRTGPRRAAAGSLDREPGRRRFLETEEASHSARFGPGGLELQLKRPSLFAWTEAPLYRQSDFVLEGEFEISPESPHSACGFLFRYQDEDNFYSALVSTKGFFRLDVVFNGSPRPLVAWTELPAPEDGARLPESAPAPGAGRAFALRIIARGSHFTFLVDDAWACEAVDETFRLGHIAFAAQNYGDGGAAKAMLKTCLLDSRPVEVEAVYYRWNFYLEPEPRARYRLAQTYFAMGEHLAAAVQIRKIEKLRALSPEELFLKAEVAIRLELYDEAQLALEACLAAEPGRREAVEEKANLLYLRSRFEELRSWLAELLPAMSDNARLADLSGHARFALGDFEGAALAYRRAAELEPDQAIYRMNEARSWDQAKRRAEAADAYLAAARLFFRQEAEDDLALALHRLAALRPRSQEVRELRAKVLFRSGRKAEAGKLLAELAQKGSTDSAVHYLLGILESERGKREEALRRFERAAELEPEYPLYAFRIAETRFLLGLDCNAALERALRLAPDDGWTLNLAGQVALGRGDKAEAHRRLEAARSALPEAAPVAVNLAELESQEGRVEEALATLAAFPEDAACRNEAGNVWAAEALRLSRRLGGQAGSQAGDGSGGQAGSQAGDGSGGQAGGDSSERVEECIERATREYERASRLDPSRAEYQANLAAAYFRLERYSEAEERVRAALDLGGESRAYLIAGNLGEVFGDPVRAETAYRLGLELSPADPDLLAALGRNYLNRRDFGKAEEVLHRLEAADRNLADILSGELEEASTEKLSCASCGRTWRVPRDLPPQSGSSVRAMPPDDSPAGACPRCGKIFCIACRKNALVDNRFTCPDCGETLKLSDNRLRWLVREHLKRAKDEESVPSGG